jgi:hypothetical protein
VSRMPSASAAASIDSTVRCRSTTSSRALASAARLLVASGLCSIERSARSRSMPSGLWASRARKCQDIPGTRHMARRSAWSVSLIVAPTRTDVRIDNAQNRGWSRRAPSNRDLPRVAYGVSGLVVRRDRRAGQRPRHLSCGQMPVLPSRDAGSRSHGRAGLGHRVRPGHYGQCGPPTAIVVGRLGT